MCIFSYFFRAGLSAYGTPIPAVENNIFNTFIQSNDKTGQVIVSMELNSTGEVSQLVQNACLLKKHLNKVMSCIFVSNLFFVLQNDYREYNWIDVTGEFYWDVGTCGELIDSEFLFSNFNITAANGDIQQPKWNPLVTAEMLDCRPQIAFSDTQVSMTATRTN